MANIRKHINKNGKISWRVQIRLKGKTHYGTFPTRQEALDWSTKKEYEIRNATYFPERIEPEPRTVGEAIDKYVLIRNENTCIR